MQNQTLMAVFRPQFRKEAMLYNIMIIIGASLFITISAQLAISVPFSPVPITGQTFAVILTGAFLGAKKGGLAVIAYLLEGISGLPVFAQAQSGIIHLFGPTGGYLLGFVPAAFLCGLLIEKGWGENTVACLGIMIIGTVVIFVCGLIGLMLLYRVDNVLSIGFYPYLPGATIKIILATILYRLGWTIVNKKQIQK